MTYTFTATPDEFSRVLRHMAYRSTAAHVVFWLAVLAPLIVFAVEVAFLGPRASGEPRWPNVTIFWGILFAMWLRRQQIVRALYRGRHIGRSETYSFSDDGVQITTPHSKVETKWSGIDELEYTDEFILMIFGGLFCYWIPKRAVPEDERQELWKLLRRHVPAPA